MKYRGGITLPSSVSSWLEQKLEEQGIDSVIYSRYVLSLLGHDPGDLLDLPHIVKGNSGKKAYNWHNSDPEGFKKSVVVKCLSSAADQPTGIENLVDELCIKLKEVESEGSGGSSCLREKPLNSGSFSSPNRYYSVFPALSSSGEWAGGLGGAWARGLNLNTSRKKEATSPKNTRRKENKENIRFKVGGTGRMRPRSMVKQQQQQGVDEGRRGGLAGLPDLPDLPVDFQQLLRSPDDSEFYTASTQPTPKITSGGHKFIQCGTNITSSIWSERMEEDGGLEAGKGGHGWDVEGTSLALGSFLSTLGMQASFSALNHDKHSSFFTEVVPKGGWVIPKRAGPRVLSGEEVGGGLTEEEEDLLTSMKTHFRPIRQDSYADGSTFLVSASVEPLDYQRSESGCLYLAPGGPKYREFKPSPPPSAAFVPKFKVKQSEKFCQTEDEEEEDDETEIDWCEDELLFPGDMEASRRLMEEERREVVVDGWVATWEVSGIWSSTNGAGLGPPPGGDTSAPACLALRTELSADGEQLLSDLSSIHLLLEPELTTPDPQAHYPKRMRIRPCPFRNGNDNL